MVCESLPLFSAEQTSLFLKATRCCSQIKQSSDEVAENRRQIGRDVSPHHPYLSTFAGMKKIRYYHLDQLAREKIKETL
jgi:hypothetical protein